MGRSEFVSAPAAARYALRALACPLAGTLFSLSACAQPPGPAMSRVQTVAGGAPTFDLRTVERSAGECEAGDGWCARFLARYPVITAGVRPPVQDALNGELRRRVAQGARVEEPGGEPSPEAIEAAAEEFLAGWRRETADWPRSTMAAVAWIDERRMEVLYSDHRLLSVELDIFSYTAGAHPNTITQLASYDLATGEPIELDDLLAPGAGARIEELGERAFRRERRVEEGESLEEAGFWFEDDRFALNDNFALTGAGLTFVYNPYEVGPYVLGPTRITLPWRAVAGLLRPDAQVVPAAAVPQPRA